MTLFALSALVRWVDVAAAMILFGSALYPLYAPTGRFLDRPLRHVVIAASILGGLAALLSAGLLLLELAGEDLGSVNLREMRDFFLASGFGHIWLAHLALSGLAIALTICLRRNSWTVRTQGWVLALVGAAVLVEQALIAQGAIAVGLLGEIGHVLHALHFLAAGLWIGGIVPLGLVLFNSPRADDGGSAGLAYRALRRFSVMSVAAAVVVLCSGVVATLMRIDAAEYLLSTDYGRFLLSKIGLFAVLAILVTVRFFVLLPRLGGAKDRRAAWTALRLLTLEGAVGLAVLGMSSTLAMLPPQ